MIPLSVPNINGNELKYVSEALGEGWVSTGGPSISKFEDAFMSYSGAEYVTACQSGTAALHLALTDARVGSGDLVVAPAITFIASINPISYVGAEPVFLDCDDSLCIDPVKAEYYLCEECEPRGDGFWYDKTLNKPVKALIAVHLFGNMADMEKLVAICKAHNIILIEDAAEAVGTFYKKGAYAGKMAGTIGDYGVYSFNGNKIITTSGGGMATSPVSGRVRHMRHLASQAKTDEIYYFHDEIGFNYRMTNIQAAIGLAQLEQLETFIKIKQANYNLYRKNGLDLVPFRKNCQANHWFYSYLCPPEGCESGGKLLRDDLIKRLGMLGIHTRPIWGLCHEQPMYITCRAYKIERAYEYYRRVVNLPCSTSLTAADVCLVAEEILSFVKNRVPEYTRLTG